MQKQSILAEFTAHREFVHFREGWHVFDERIEQVTRLKADRFVGGHYHIACGRAIVHSHKQSEEAEEAKQIVTNMHRGTEL